MSSTVTVYFQQLFTVHVGTCGTHIDRELMKGSLGAREKYNITAAEIDSR
jgi:hypothetical protein